MVLSFLSLEVLMEHNGSVTKHIPREHCIPVPHQLQQLLLLRGLEDAVVPAAAMLERSSLPCFVPLAVCVCPSLPSLLHELVVEPVRRRVLAQAHCRPGLPFGE